MINSFLLRSVLKARQHNKTLANITWRHKVASHLGSNLKLIALFTRRKSCLFFNYCFYLLLFLLTVLFFLQSKKKFYLLFSLALSVSFNDWMRNVLFFFLPKAYTNFCFIYICLFNYTWLVIYIASEKYLPKAF